MPLRSLPLLALATTLGLLSGGCGPTVVASRPLTAATLVDLRRDVEGRRVTVEILPPAAPPSPSPSQSPLPFPPPSQSRPTRPSDGLVTHAGIAHFDNDLLRLQDGANQVQVPLGRVQSIDANHPYAGALLGMLAMGALGAVGGGVWGYTHAPGPGEDLLGLGRGGWAVIEAAALAVPFAAVGTLGGAMLGAGPVWTFR